MSPLMKYLTLMSIVLVGAAVCSAQTPTVLDGGVLNGASFAKGQPVSPGGLVSIFGTGKDAPGVSGTGSMHQLMVQAIAAGFIIVFNVIGTSVILFVIKIFVPLRMDEATLKIGDDAVHGETAYAIGVEGE